MGQLLANGPTEFYYVIDNVSWHTLANIRKVHADLGDRALGAMNEDLRSGRYFQIMVGLNGQRENMNYSLLCCTSSVAMQEEVVKITGPNYAIGRLIVDHRKDWEVYVQAISTPR